MIIDTTITPADLAKPIQRLYALAGQKALDLDQTWDFSRGAPVITVQGKYTARQWTQWTQGFQFGIPLLVFEATGEQKLLELVRQRIREHMAIHVTHMGVHDHGFNTMSTYGNLRRLMLAERIPHNAWELDHYELAIKASGAVQAARWASTSDGLGYIYSFNGPHSLFVDTMRTLRVLCLAHELGHVLMGENDVRISLLDRATMHAFTTAKYLVCDGTTGHAYDICGRTAHEGIFNHNNGQFRCRSTQQGYSPFSTWTRGLAWAMLGFVEQLEFMRNSPEPPPEGVRDTIATMEQAARSTCDHYIADCSAADGIPYWDDGAPGLAKLDGWRERPADPFNEFEPVDSSAAAIAAQGLLKLGRYFGSADGQRYTYAGLTIARTLLSDVYTATDPKHQGLLIHSIYHRPNNWDHIPSGRKVPCGEASMWGDYHLIELAAIISQ